MNDNYNLIRDHIYPYLEVSNIEILFACTNNLICIEIRGLYSLVLPLFGFVCCGTQIKVKAPPLNEDIYLGRKTDGHYMNIQLVCDADLRFLDAVVK